MYMNSSNNGIKPSKINPDVRRLLHQNILDATQLDIRQKAAANMGVQLSETPADEKVKRACCHFTYEGPEPMLRLRRNNEGRVICDVCNREIFTDFKGERNVDILMEACKVINQALVFGIFNNLLPEPIRLLISLKEVLPDAAKLVKQLNQYILKEEANNNAAANLGTEYFNNFTSMM